ncbi:hypothetical protein LCGC14_0514860 [marine sediment metagenome]|uniref:Uncharacterized protein n=1 Tax=marine sediment metagenome TaxID=412755 RepID=A0A0F9S039_9ZZZZ|nr:hypothetical protein [Candidatus Aminicenantes bacterium]
MKYLLIIIFLLTSCSWNKTDQMLLGSYAVLSAVDAYQTANMPEGVTEGMPWLRGDDRRPDMDKVYVWKGLALIGLYFWSDYFEEHRTLSLGAANGLQGAVVIYNLEY